MEIYRIKNVIEFNIISWNQLTQLINQVYKRIQKHTDNKFYIEFKVHGQHK
jgi:hypothetical protein